jgi:EAL domain-containing protein (putative c-di-GMP-specific phosphodiesterase class I)
MLPFCRNPTMRSFGTTGAMPLDTAESLISAVRSQRDRFVGFAFAAADLLIEVTSDGRIAFIAGAAQNLYGAASENLIGTSFFDLLCPADGTVARALVGSLARGGRFVPVSLRLARDNAPVLLGGCRLPNNKDSLFLSLASGIGAAPDGQDGKPTNLLSQAEFASEATKRMLEDTAGSYQLTLIAIDELESLQERLTEEVGQGLAAAVERYLYNCTTGVDAAGEFGNGRYGLLHREAVDVSRLQEGVESLAKAIDPTGTGVSLRSATMQLDKTGMSGADAARALVYCINGFADSDNGDLSIPNLRDGLDKALSSTLVRVSNLRATLGDRNFRLVYQPIVDLRSREIHHLEALTRFVDNGSPADTIAFAEAVRLIADFDLAVCEMAIAAVLDNPLGRLPIAVNLSGRSLESSVFANTLFEMLRVDRNLSKHLLFEVTESAVITRADEVNARIQALRGSGFRVCLDDFGAGANSFHYLRSFEVDFIKVDGAFAHAALRDPRDRILLRTIAGFCREIGVAAIVEMVEDEETALAFAKLGLAYAQGYHFGRPGELPQEAPLTIAAPGGRRAVRG